ncbi:zinc finger protein CONSTANS-LIKE 12 isoform X2 [Benincasa hispida]|nr:zinc finger protein CONSTANS-LIKE 12 isoform X2 [Benincasa hispida]
MEPLCEFCGVVRAVVYCKSDSARLCLQCDGRVHSANSLSRRHLRSLLCDKCNAQPAIVRCMDDKLSLCQGCDWNNANACSSLGHPCQLLHSYSGCPSMPDFSRIWSSVLDSSSTPICPTSSSTTTTSTPHSISLTHLHPWIPASAAPPPASAFSPNPSFHHFPFSSDVSNLPKGCFDFKDITTHENNDICEALNLGDVSLNLENGEELFGCPGTMKCQFEDGELDCLLLEKNLFSVTESDGGPVDNAIEDTSSGQQDFMGFQSSEDGLSMNMIQNGNSNCMLMNPSCNGNINVGFPTGQVHSSMSLSLSNVTGEGSAADYQDCGLSPAFLTEASWDPSMETIGPQAKDRNRDKAKMRYNEKKKTRT